MKNTLNEFINKVLDDLHNFSPELSLERQIEYNRNFVNQVLNEQCSPNTHNFIFTTWYAGEKIETSIEAENKEIAIFKFETIYKDHKWLTMQKVD